MNIIQKLFAASPAPDLGKLIQEGALLVDVRTAAEFSEGHVKGSVNIPLDMLSHKLDQLKNKKHIIVFCLSGGRSARAKSLLEKAGLSNVVNGGTWANVSRFVK